MERPASVLLFFSLARNMPHSSLTLDTDRRGAALIGVGLTVVVAAHLVAGVPIAAATVLIGWGTLLTVASRPHGGPLAMLNLPVYGCLGSFAIASQTHAALGSNVGRLPLLVDHALALVLLVGLTIDTARRLLQASTDSR
jgi:hypothetical protein